MSGLLGAALLGADGAGFGGVGVEAGWQLLMALVGANGLLGGGPGAGGGLLELETFKATSRAEDGDALGDDGFALGAGDVALEGVGEFHVFYEQFAELFQVVGEVVELVGVLVDLALEVGHLGRGGQGRGVGEGDGGLDHGVGDLFGLVKDGRGMTETFVGFEGEFFSLGGFGWGRDGFLGKFTAAVTALAGQALATGRHRENLLSLFAHLLVEMSLEIGWLGALACGVEQATRIKVEAQEPFDFGREGVQRDIEAVAQIVHRCKQVIEEVIGAVLRGEDAGESTPP